MLVIFYNRPIYTVYTKVDNQGWASS